MAWSPLSPTWKGWLLALGTVLYILIPGSSLMLMLLAMLRSNSAGLGSLVPRYWRYLRTMYTSQQKALWDFLRGSG